MIKPNNMWEAHAVRKLTNPIDVVAEIERCKQGMVVAPSETKQAEWQRKTAFLEKLLKELQ